MRRVVILMALMALFLTPAVARAKLSFFGLDVHPIRPGVREPITLTMTCSSDEDHTRPTSSCFGAGSTMAWVQPLDEEGRFDRADWSRGDAERAPSSVTP